MTINGHNLPDSVNVLGTEYKIFCSTPEEDPKMKDNKGYTELCAKEIHINPLWFGVIPKDDSAPELVMKDIYKEGLKVLRHELIHAFINESGLSECCGWAGNEELVDWLARQFPKMLDCFKKAKLLEE